MATDLWAPERAWWWTALLFAAGSSCFLVAPLPGFLRVVGPETDAAVFFAGSLLFTAAAVVQLLSCPRPQDGIHQAGEGRSRWGPDRLIWWSSLIQLLGTLFFNITTFRALSITLESPSYDRLVWRPDAFGSVCFLLSGVLAYRAVARDDRGSSEGRMALTNLVGCVAFGIAAAGAYVLPSTTSEVNVTVVNVMTSLGAAAFLLGALLLVRVSR